MKQNYRSISLPLTCLFIYFTLNNPVSDNIQFLLLHLMYFLCLCISSCVYECVFLIIIILDSRAFCQPGSQNSHSSFKLSARVQCDKEQLLQQERTVLRAFKLVPFVSREMELLVKCEFSREKKERRKKYHQFLSTNFMLNPVQYSYRFDQSFFVCLFLISELSLSLKQLLLPLRKNWIFITFQIFATGSQKEVKTLKLLIKERFQELPHSNYIKNSFHMVVLLPVSCHY